MKCPNCGNEVDTSLCVACPNCKTRMLNPNFYPQEIGMQDSFGNRMTVGGSLDRPRKKVNRKAVITLIVVAIVIASVIIGVSIYNYNRPKTYDEKIDLAKEYAEKVINKQLRYENLNTWYANNYITDDGDNKFIIFCDVYGALITSGYGRIQMYVGIELKENGHSYTYWTTGNVYPYGGDASYYVSQLKNSMGW